MKTDTKTLIKEVRSHAFHLLKLGCYDEESNFLTEASDRLEQFAGIEIVGYGKSITWVNLHSTGVDVTNCRNIGDLIDMRNRQEGGR